MYLQQFWSVLHRMYAQSYWVKIMAVLSAVLILSICFVIRDTSVSNLARANTASAALLNVIVSENALAGDTDWILTNPGNDVGMQIKGFASKASVNKGNAIDFHITVTPAQLYDIEIYRMGWYGGDGARKIQTINNLAGLQQPSPILDATTGLVTAPWSVSYTLNVPATWVSGVYLAKLTNANGYQNYIKFVVRDDARSADFLYQNSTTTDQAYNNFPDDSNSFGKSLYGYNSHGANTISGGPQAVKVSFDRPYWGNGAGWFFSWEYNLIRWLEKEGYDVAYSDNIETHANGSRLLNNKAFISSGHDEYWSKEMFDNAETARDAGVHLAFFGSNNVYWQTRFEPSASNVPNRTMVVYKSGTLDPEPDNALKTIRFRQVGRAEQSLLGIMYETYNTNSNAYLTDYTVQNDTHWAYTNSGFSNGDTVPDIIGFEIDLLNNTYSPSCSQSQVLISSSPFVGYSSPTTIYANTSIYQAPSGAWVFASGTMSWSWALDKSGYVDARLQQTTKNVLDEFLFLGTAGPASNSASCAPPTSPPTEQATLVSPSGVIANTSPTFTWNDDVANATSYRLAIYELPSWQTEYSIVHASSTICSNGSCSLTPPGVVLTDGATYRWYVRGSNSAGDGPWSTYLSITVSASSSSPPNIVTQISPSSSSTINAGSSITFSWSEESTADNYRIVVYDTVNDEVDFDQTYAVANVSCDSSGVCTKATTQTFPAGSFKWLIRASNSYGDGPWSVYP